MKNSRISELKMPQAKKLELTAERIAQEYMRIAFANVADTLDDANEVQPINQLPRDVSAAISTISVSSSIGERKATVRMHDKLKALEALERLLPKEAPTETKPEISIEINLPEDDLPAVGAD